MGLDIQEQISRLRASVVEGRVENVRYRQDQLYALHGVLLEYADKITLAITDDSGCSMEDAETEFYLGMDALRKSYESLNFEKSLKDEYLVASGNSNEDKRVALGLIAIKASRHSHFYSIVGAISAAITAGNCILLELDDSSPAVDTALRRTLPTALDQDTFQISSSQLDEKFVADIDLLVDQTDSSHYPSIKTVLSPQSRTIAIIDRSSNLETAAEAVIKARISARGQSPYSPDLVVVNEFVGEAFGLACLNYADNCGYQSEDSNPSASKKTQDLLETLKKDSSIRMHRSRKTNLAVVEILDRKSPLLEMKVDGPFILTLRSTGLVDSVELQRSSTPFLACYVFASLGTCKFLSEQVSSYATYINHIPAQLLVGPSSPLNYPHALHPRYTTEMFSSSRPQFVTPPKSLPTTEKLKEIAMKRLVPTGQRPGHAMGFFEQGILIGLGSTAIVVLPLLGWSLFTVAKHGWRFVSARMN